MQVLVFALCLLSQAPETDADAPAQKNRPGAVSDYLRDNYLADAAKYEFFQEDGRTPLELVKQPIMRWSNDDDWSGDVFVWTHESRPQVVGCILSGPSGQTNRLMFHEFHLLAERPLAPADLHTKRRWQPKEGLKTLPVSGAPQPARSAAGRLAQMREISRGFTAAMEADGEWELRLLPQPLYRFGKGQGDVVDGALFAYVWTKGTDPEVILLIECRKTESGLAWHFAPVRFSNRQVWLKYEGQEVWRVESHREPPGSSSDLLYTTAYARTMPREPAQSTDGSTDE